MIVLSQLPRVTCGLFLRFSQVYQINQFWGTVDAPSLHVFMFTVDDVVPFSLMEVDGAPGLV